MNVSVYRLYAQANSQVAPCNQLALNILNNPMVDCLPSGAANCSTDPDA
jgi:hypothetical protein